MILRGIPTRHAASQWLRAGNRVVSIAAPEPCVNKVVVSAVKFSPLVRCLGKLPCVVKLVARWTFRRADLGNVGTVGLATKWLRILSLGDIDKTCNHLVANPIGPPAGGGFFGQRRRGAYGKTAGHWWTLWMQQVSVGREM